MMLAIKCHEQDTRASSLYLMKPFDKHFFDFSQSPLLFSSIYIEYLSIPLMHVYIVSLLCAFRRLTNLQTLNKKWQVKDITAYGR